MSKIWIKEIGHYLPPQAKSNQDLIDEFGVRMKSDWVKRVVGIEERRWASDEMTTSDLAYESVRKMNLADFEGAIYLSTVGGDFLTPSTSSILKRKLGFTGGAPTFDINAACAGQVFALELACQRLISTSETQALVVASEVRSRFINKEDRKTLFLFSDAASSFLVEKRDDPPGEIEWILTKTFASSEYEILVPGGGSRNPFSQEVLDSKEHCITMNNGANIVEKTTEQMVKLVQESLHAKKVSVEDYDLFVFHQGNGNLIRTICENLGIPEKKAWINFDKYGNSSSASAGVSLSDAYSQGAIKKGSRVLFLAMGAGYHLGITSIRWGLD